MVTVELALVDIATVDLAIAVVAAVDRATVDLARGRLGCRLLSLISCLSITSVDLLLTVLACTTTPRSIVTLALRESLVSTNELRLYRWNRFFSRSQDKLHDLLRSILTLLILWSGAVTALESPASAPCR